MKVSSISSGVLLILISSMASAQIVNRSEEELRKAPGVRVAMATPTDAGMPVERGTTQGRYQVRERQESIVQLTPTLGYVSSSFADFQSSKGAKVDNLNGYQAGVQANIGRGKIQLETGLVYSERGGKVTNMPLQGFNFEGRGDFDIKLQYLEIPALAKYSFGSRQGFQVSLKGGAVLGILQSAERKTVRDTTNPQYRGTDEVKDFYQPVDVRLAAGAGTSYRMSESTSMLLQVDYQYGLKSILKDTSIYEPKTSSFAISAGVILDL